MTNMIKSAAAAAVLATAAIAASTPALAQRGGTAAATGNPVVVVADVEAAVQQSAAFQAAVAQIRTTYAAQITNIETRRTALQTELQTLYQAVQTEQNRNPRNQTALETAARNFQTRQQAAERELAELNAPIELAVSYAQEQITLRVGDAVNTARTARRADLVLTRNAAVGDVAPSADLTPAIVTELNRLVPSVQITPPAGYQPGALMRAAQQQAAGQPAAPAQQPQTR